jgi:hypothetical protein
MAPLNLDIDVLPIGPGVLHPDLLPGNVWGSNLRGIFSRDEWDDLRIPVCEAADNRCEVCKEHSVDRSGRQRRPDCHELWHFESTAEAKVQRLIRLIALCVDCHRVQHIGLAQVKGELPLVRRQLKKVNSWTDSQVDRAMDDAVARYEWRGRYGWDLDLSLLADKIRIDTHPSLRIPADDRRSLGNSFS